VRSVAPGIRKAESLLWLALPWQCKASSASAAAPRRIVVDAIKAWRMETARQYNHTVEPISVSYQNRRRS